MCLADLNNDGETLLALVDFKKRNTQSLGTDQDWTQGNFDPQNCSKSPFNCRMRVYRGQHLIFNHFLDDLPCSLIAYSISQPQQEQRLRQFQLAGGKRDSPRPANDSKSCHQQTLLGLTINDDVYFYHKLRPSHRLSLEDDECIIETLNKSEVDAWQMVKQNKVDLGALHELLTSLSQELGTSELTSHTNNFLSLSSSAARKQYLLSWKLKRLQDGVGESLMSMDTICCAAARLKYDSTITRSGDFGQTRDQDATIVNSAKWNMILDIQKDGLVLGTEDRHLLIYELRTIKSRLECHYRLPSTPDHILVERRSPASFSSRCDLRSLTYKILISCRNSKIYSIDQLYLYDKSNLENSKCDCCKLEELISLKCNVVEMSWSGLEFPNDGDNRDSGAEASKQTFIVACLDRRVYCFSSFDGACKWVVDVELPITSIVCLPSFKIGSEETSLIGVGSQINRVDFYLSSSGRIVDSIYFSHNDFPQAMTFGRFGREDNCLCLVTNRGQLLIFILKRMAKFVHGQCLSSASSYASDTMAKCSRLLQQRSASSCFMSPSQDFENKEVSMPKEDSTHHININEPVKVPSNLSLSKNESTSSADRLIDSVLKSEHECDQVSAELTLKAKLRAPQLTVPIKGREFVNNLVKQSRQSGAEARIFAKQMFDLVDKTKLTMGKKTVGGPLNSNVDMANEFGNRICLCKINGLGNVYRVNIGFRLNVHPLLSRYTEQICEKYKRRGRLFWAILIHIRPTTDRCKVSPFSFSIPIDSSAHCDSGLEAKGDEMFEGSINFKLTSRDQNSGLEPGQDDTITVDLHAMLQFKSIELAIAETIIRKPVCIQSVNLPAG